MVEFRFFRLVQHQADAAVIKKGRLAGAEQVRQAQHIAVEGRGAVHVVGVMAICAMRASAVFSCEFMATVLRERKRE